MMALGGLAALLLPSAAGPAASSPPPPPKGVLFIVVDDMRPSIGAYNETQQRVHTPHLDRLSAEGLLFTRTYVQYALCGPSRNSFLSGRRPDTTRVWNFINHFVRTNQCVFAPPPALPSL